jgi:hypothetical protein
MFLNIPQYSLIVVDYFYRKKLHRRKNRQNEVEIQMDDVHLILGDQFSSLQTFLRSAFCVKCEDQTHIEKFRIFLDDTNDIIFDGYCGKCGTAVSRYIETGESSGSSEIAMHIRAVRKL